MDQATELRNYVAEHGKAGQSDGILCFFCKGSRRWIHEQPMGGIVTDECPYCTRERQKSADQIVIEFDVKQALNMANGFILEWEKQNGLPMTETRKAILQALSHFENAK